MPDQKPPFLNIAQQNASNVPAFKSLDELLEDIKKQQEEKVKNETKNTNKDLQGSLNGQKKTPADAAWNPMYSSLMKMSPEQVKAFQEKYCKDTGHKMSDAELKEFIGKSYDEMQKNKKPKTLWDKYADGWSQDFKDAKSASGFWNTAKEVAKAVVNRTGKGAVTLGETAAVVALAPVAMLSSCSKVEIESNITTNVNVDLTKITELLTLAIDKLTEMNLNIQIGNDTLSNKLTELLNMYKQNKIDDDTFKSQILNLFGQLNTKLDGMGENSQATSKSLEKLLAAYKAGTMTITELLAQVNSLLKELKEIGLSTLDALNGFITKYDKNTKESDQTFKDILKELTEIKAGAGNNNEAIITILKELMSKYDTNTVLVSDALTNMLEKLDTIIKENGGDGNKITIKDLEKLIKETYKDPTEMLKTIATLLENLGTKENITIEDLKALIEANKTDMGETNDLIKTVITTLTEMNKNLGANSTANMEKLMTELIAKYEQGTITEQELLKEISTKMDKLVTVDQLNEALDKFGDKQTANSEKIFSDILKELKSISTGVGDTNSSIKNLTKLFESFSSNSTDMTVSLGNIEKLIQTLITNNEGNKPLTIEDLKKMMTEIYKDPTEALSNITELLKTLNLGSGSNITLEQLEKLIKENKVDMTETNNLMKSVITSLGDINVKLGESGTAALEKLVTELITKYEKGSITQEELLKEISGKMDKLVTVDQLNEALDKFGDKLIGNSEKISKEMLEKMEQILQTAGNNTNLLSELKTLLASFTSNSTEMGNSLKNIETLIQTLITNNAGNKPLTIEDLKAMMKEIYKDPTEALNNITELLKTLNLSAGSNITLEQLEKLLKENKVDMSETNNLLKSVVDKLAIIEKNTEKTGNESNLEKMLAEFMAKFDAGTMSITELLAAMSTKMDKFVTVDALTNILDNFYAKTSADNNKNHTELLNAVNNNTTSINDLKKIFENYKTTSESMVNIMSQIGDKIDVLIKESGKPGSGITAEDLEKIIKENYKDPTPLLAEIKNLLINLGYSQGNQITLSQLSQLLVENKADFTKTNKLIADLIAKVEAGQLSQADANKQIIDALKK